MSNEIENLSKAVKLLSDEKMKKKLWDRIYYLRNREDILKKEKEEYSKNKDLIIVKQKEYYEANKEVINEKKKELYAKKIKDTEFREKERERIREYKRKNKEKLAEKGKEYRENNKEKRAETQKNYRIKNKEIISFKRNTPEYRKYQKEKAHSWTKENYTKHMESVKKWKSLNKDKVIWSNMRRRKAVVQATIGGTMFQKEIVDIYLERNRITEETGIEHNVDHIVPLNNESVCGLHIPANLRIIPKDVNMKKSNKVEDLKC